MKLLDQIIPMDEIKIREEIETLKIAIQNAESLDALITELDRRNVSTRGVILTKQLLRKFSVKEIWDYVDINTNSVQDIEKYLTKYAIIGKIHPIPSKLEEKKERFIEDSTLLCTKLQEYSMPFNVEIYAILITKDNKLCYYHIDNTYKKHGNSHNMMYYFNLGKKLRLQLLNGTSQHICNCDSSKNYLELIGFVTATEFVKLNKCTPNEVKEIATRQCYILPYNICQIRDKYKYDLTNDCLNIFNKYVDETKYIEYIINCITRSRTKKSAIK